MKILSLLIWVGQFGFSIIFPILFFLLLAVWLQGRFGLGLWIVAVLGSLGLLTSISTARACLRSLRKAAKVLGVDHSTLVKKYQRLHPEPGEPSER